MVVGAEDPAIGRWPPACRPSPRGPGAVSFGLSAEAENRGAELVVRIPSKGRDGRTHPSSSRQADAKGQLSASSARCSFPAPSGLGDAHPHG